MIRLTTVLMIAATLSLAACAMPDNQYPRGKSLVTYNYQAADALISRAGKSISKDSPMLVGTVANVNDVESSSTLGRMISEQVSARLAAKGYRIAELKLRQGISIQESSGFDPSAGGEYLLSRDASEVTGEHKASAAVTGTYAVGAKNVLVSLRLIDIRSGRVITAYDYSMPKTADITVMSGATGNTDSSFFGHSWAY